MWGDRSLLKRINNLERKLPKPEEDASYLIEVGENGGNHYKVADGEKILIDAIPKFKLEDNITLEVTITEGSL